MNHRASVGSLGGSGGRRQALGVQGSHSDAQWESGIHLPNVTNLSTSSTKLKTIAILGHKKVTHVSWGATLSAKERKSCADSNVVQQSWGDRESGPG